MGDSAFGLIMLTPLSTCAHFDSRLQHRLLPSCGTNKDVRMRISRREIVNENFGDSINPLTPELNPSAQRFLARFFIGDFAS
jgi:hypothetical protein